MFSARMTYLVVNPYWNLPTTIAVEDILPRLQKDSAYLTPRSIRVFRNWDMDAPEVDPVTVDWQVDTLPDSSTTVSVTMLSPRSAQVNVDLSIDS